MDKAGVIFWLVWWGEGGVVDQELLSGAAQLKVVKSMRHLKMSGEAPCEHTNLGGISRWKILEVTELDEDAKGGGAGIQWGGLEAEPQDPPPWKVREKSKKWHRT